MVSTVIFAETEAEDEIVMVRSAISIAAFKGFVAKSSIWKVSEHQLTT